MGLGVGVGVAITLTYTGAQHALLNPLSFSAMTWKYHHPGESESTTCEVPVTVAWLMRSRVRLTAVTPMPFWVHSMPAAPFALTMIHCKRYLVAPSDALQWATTIPSEF